MGGHAAGEVASSLVIAALAPLDDDDPGDDLLAELREATVEGNAAITRHVADAPDLEGMGTTLTAILFAGTRLGMVHVGDSRAYLLRDGDAHPDHQGRHVRPVADRRGPDHRGGGAHPPAALAAAARAQRARRRPVADRSARSAPATATCSAATACPAWSATRPSPSTLARYRDPRECADRLIQLALRGGGPDNITCIVADVVDVDFGDDAPIVGGAVGDGRDESPPPDSAAARASATTMTRAAPPRVRARRPRTAPPRCRGLRIVAGVVAVLAVLAGGGRARPAVGAAAVLRRRRTTTSVAIFQGVRGERARAAAAATSSSTPTSPLDGPHRRPTRNTVRRRHPRHRGRPGRRPGPGGSGCAASMLAALPGRSSAAVRGADPADAGAAARTVGPRAGARRSGPGRPARPEPGPHPDRRHHAAPDSGPGTRSQLPAGELSDLAGRVGDPGAGPRTPRPRSPRPAHRPQHRAGAARVRRGDRDARAGARRGEPGADSSPVAALRRCRLPGPVHRRAPRGAPVRAVRRPAAAAERRAAQRPRPGDDPPAGPGRRRSRRRRWAASAPTVLVAAAAGLDGGRPGALPRRAAGGARPPHARPLRLHRGLRRAGPARDARPAAVVSPRSTARRSGSGCGIFSIQPGEFAKILADHLLRRVPGAEARAVHRGRPHVPRHGVPPRPRPRAAAGRLGALGRRPGAGAATSARRCCSSASCS